MSFSGEIGDKRMNRLGRFCGFDVFCEFCKEFDHRDKCLIFDIKCGQSTP